jgi:hypothetical protein
MFDLSQEAMVSLDKFGPFEPRSANTSSLSGPYKYTQDKFNIECFQSAITNYVIDPARMKKCDTTYYGQYNSEGLREGYGILISSTYEHFSGMFKNDMPSGDGRIIFNNGDVLIG